MKKAASISTALFMMVFSLPFMGIGAMFGHRYYSIKQNGEPAKAWVVNMVNNGEGSYAPVIEFTTRDGQDIRYEHNMYSSPPAFKEGDYIDIYYLPDSPDKDVYIKSIMSWAFPLIFFGMGSLFFCIGLWQLIRQSRGRRQANQEVTSLEPPYKSLADEGDDIKTPESFMKRN